VSGWEAMQQGAPDPFFADQRPTWIHLCLGLVRDAAPNWIMETPKGETCDECGKTESDA
jgi:hypothetical protein